MVAPFNRRHICSCRRLLIACFTVLLSACAATGVKTASNTQSDQPVSKQKAATAIDTPNEKLLLAAENHAGLISLYKQQLDRAETDAESDTLRLKIADSYLATGDFESALFYLEPVIAAGRGSAGLFLVKSRAHLSAGQPSEALQAAIVAHGFHTGFGAGSPGIDNQLGKVQAELGNYDSARRHFLNARQGMMDDAVVKNNLAMLDMLEGHYDAAADRLLTLQMSGQADQQVRANLAIALAKSGRYQQFSSIFGEDKREQTVALFQLLSSVQTVPERAVPERTVPK